MIKWQIQGLESSVSWEHCSFQMCSLLFAPRSPDFHAYCWSRGNFHLNTVYGYEEERHQLLCLLNDRRVPFQIKPLTSLPPCETKGKSWKKRKNKQKKTTKNNVHPKSTVLQKNTCWHQHIKKLPFTVSTNKPSKLFSAHRNIDLRHNHIGEDDPWSYHGFWLLSLKLFQIRV